MGGEWESGLWQEGGESVVEREKGENIGREGGVEVGLWGGNGKVGRKARMRERV